MAVMTQFLCLDLPLPHSPRDVMAAVEQALQSYGDPLRWAITHVNRDRQTMSIEAVVLPNPLLER
jgi:hypothetical protein